MMGETFAISEYFNLKEQMTGKQHADIVEQHGNDEVTTAKRKKR